MKSRVIFVAFLLGFGASEWAFGQFKVGDVAEGLETDGKWYKVDILKVEPGKYFIHWQGFDKRYDRWIEVNKVRAIGQASGSGNSGGGKFKVGDVAEGLETDGKWYKVDILKAEEGRYFIHWQGFGTQYDRWIEATKIRAIGEAGNVAYATGEGGFKKGDIAEALNRDGKWYEVEIWNLSEQEYGVRWTGVTGPNWVKKDMVRAKGSGANQALAFQVGDRIHAEVSGAWKSCTIANIADASGSKKYSVTFDDGGRADITEDRIRQYNFTGKDFKAGQFVRIRYSGNDSLDTPIVDVKDQQFMIVYGGHGSKWFPFDSPELRNDVKAAAAAAAAGAQQQFWSDCAPFQEAVLTFSWLENPTSSGELSTWTSRGQSWKEEERIQQIRNDYEKLEKLAEIIKAKGYESLAAEGGAMSGKAATGNPTFLIKTAQKRAEYGAKLVRLVLEADIKTITDFLKTVPELGNMSGGKLLSFYDDKRGVVSTVEYSKNDCKTLIEGQRNRAAKFLAAIGKTEDPEVTKMLTGLQSAATIAKKEFTANIQQSSLPTFPHKDAAIEAAAKTAVEKIIPGAVVIRTGALDADWKISKNSLGIPECRLKFVGVVFKDPVTGYCAYAPMQMGQDYTSNGTYSTTTYISTLYGYVFRYYIAKCQ